MNFTHHCLICLGSNTDAEAHLSCALDSLRTRFRIVDCGGVVRSPDTETGRPSRDYLNQVLLVECREDEESLRALLKSIERENGRTDGSKLAGVMPLDIDLLVFDGVVLKPDDMGKWYVAESMRGLSAPITC